MVTNLFSQLRDVWPHLRLNRFRKRCVWDYQFSMLFRGSRNNKDSINDVLEIATTRNSNCNWTSLPFLAPDDNNFDVVVVFIFFLEKRERRGWKRLPFHNREIYQFAYKLLMCPWWDINNLGTTRGFCPMNSFLEFIQDVFARFKNAYKISWRDWLRLLSNATSLL